MQIECRLISFHSSCYHHAERTMTKRMRSSVCYSLLVSLLFIVPTPAGSQAIPPALPDFTITTMYYVIKPEAVGSKDFEELQALLGTWTADTAASKLMNDLVTSKQWGVKPDGQEQKAIANAPVVVRPDGE